MQQHRPLLAALILDALDDLERSLSGLTPTDAERRMPGFSSVSYTVGHVAQHIDSWVNDSLAGKQRDTYLSSNQFARGSAGDPVPWETVNTSFVKVLERARSYLANVDEKALAHESAYTGNQEALKGKIVTGNYRLARLVAHIYYHVGEIGTVRTTMGHRIQDFPSWLPGFLTSTGTLKAPTTSQK